MRRLPLVLTAVIASALLAAPAAQAKRLTTSAASATAQRVAERYADLHDAEDHGVDSCERRNRRTIRCDVFVSIAVDDATQRECTATVTVRIGNRRKAKPASTASAWTCVDEDVSAGDESEEFGDDAPVEEDEPLPADDDLEY